jgi:hypothetical protein
MAGGRPSARQVPQVILRLQRFRFGPRVLLAGLRQAGPYPLLAVSGESARQIWRIARFF